MKAYGHGLGKEPTFNPLITNNLIYMFKRNQLIDLLWQKSNYF